MFGNVIFGIYFEASVTNTSEELLAIMRAYTITTAGFCGGQLKVHMFWWSQTAQASAFFGFSFNTFFNIYYIRSRNMYVQLPSCVSISASDFVLFVSLLSETILVLLHTHILVHHWPLQPLVRITVMLSHITQAVCLFCFSWVMGPTV